ncbi:hypothetical protein PHLCEN_2v4919 [Hermanssonia centrifuga]|uniref:Uncharacterized protein n=1 Tax=Hermanssonia centrifuga TaxID=98765 RepID=A0A2R6PFZ0_9APHY|nr:hypothetical protein PHLCEN_2v5815 [Hermanssonia centrifuga]PSR90357.1 hypothetical protein PHLCEN_2v4919 [Hermanssonia centrifuga]
MSKQYYAASKLNRRTSIFFLIITVAAVSLGLYVLGTTLVKSRLAGPRKTTNPSFAVLFDELVAMKVTDTVRYQLDTREGIEEFARSLPSGGHLVHIRPDDSEDSDPQPYTVTLFHQLECLDVIRQGYSKVPSEPAPGHVHHCMNYLRSTILCRPSLLLEPVVDIYSQVSGEGYDAVCRNWEAVYHEAERNNEAYMDWSRSRS